MAAPRVIPFGQGLRGSEDFLAQSLYDAAGTAANQVLRPKDYRSSVLYLAPNGSAPLTAMLSSLKSEPTSDPEFYWYEKTIPDQDGTVTGMYSDADLATGVASSIQAAGTTIFLKIPIADAAQVRVGHVLVLRDASAAAIRVNALITAKTSVDATYASLRVTLIEAMSVAAVAGVDTFVVIGNANAEGAVIPDSISFDAVQIYNYTQIFRTPYELTRTAMKTRLRTGDQLKEIRREALLMHSIEMEKAYLWGTLYQTTGDNGKPMRFTNGLIPMAITYGTTSDFYSSSDYDGKTWVTGGEDWLNEQLEVIFRYGGNTRMAYCGSGALLGIQRLVQNGASINIQPGAGKYGIKVMEWLTPFGTLILKTHPLFSQRAVDRNRMLVFEPGNLNERYIDQTQHKMDDGMTKGGYNAIDGIKGEFLTEAGLEYHHLETTAVLDGFNTDNPS